MFYRKKLRSVIRKLTAAVAGARSIAFGISASWMCCFPFAQEPIELLLAGTTLALAQVVGLMSKAISRTAGRCANESGAAAHVAEVSRRQ